MITYILKDEAPKAPVYIYSVHNSHKIDMDSMDEQERTNAQTRQLLLDINQSLFMSEITENSELLIPFDEVRLGSKLKEFLSGYDNQKVFH